MKKYILRWWVYPSAIACLSIIIFYTVSVIFFVFQLGVGFAIYEGIGESFLESLPFLSDLPVPLLVMSGFSLLLVALGTVTFYLSDLRLRSYLKHAHRLPVLSAIVLFVLFHLGAFVILLFVTLSIATKTESATRMTDTAIYNMVETGMDRSTDEADRLHVETILNKSEYLRSIQHLMDPILKVVFAQYPIALILYALQAKRIARDYAETKS